jgi:hypothetical protein
VSAVADTTKAQALVLGGVTLVGSVFLGKLLVDQVQGPELAHSTDFNESVRLVASLVGISVTLLQLPTAWAEAQKLLKSSDLPLPVSP